MGLHVMLIYEIVRHIIDPEYKRDYSLNFTFSSGIGFIYVIVIWGDGFKEIHKFKLNPETSIEVSVPLIWENNTYVFELL